MRDLYVKYCLCLSIVLLVTSWACSQPLFPGTFIDAERAMTRLEGNGYPSVVLLPDTLEAHHHFSIQGSIQDCPNHRVQQAAGRSLFGLSSSGYRPLGKLKLAADFAYHRGSYADINWNSRLWNNSQNSFALVDSIGGDWIKEGYLLGVQAGYQVNDRWVLGLDVDLDLSTGGRDNNPRPLGNASRIGIAPSVGLTVGARDQVFLSGNYLLGKEEITYSTYQENTGYTYFKMNGMRLVDSPESRFTTALNYKQHVWNLGLSWFHQANGNGWYFAGLFYTHSLERATLDPFSGAEDAETGLIYVSPERVSDFLNRTVNGRISLLFNETNWNHRFDFRAEIGEARNYMITSQVTNFRFRYQHYTLEWKASGYAIGGAKWLVGGSVAYSRQRSLNFQYGFEQLNGLEGNILLGRHWLLPSGSAFELEGTLGLFYDLNSLLSIEPASDFIESESVVTENVTKPDFRLSTSDRVGTGVAFTWFIAGTRLSKPYVQLRYHSVGFSGFEQHNQSVGVVFGNYF